MAAATNKIKIGNFLTAQGTKKDDIFVATPGRAYFGRNGNDSIWSDGSTTLLLDSVEYWIPSIMSGGLDNDNYQVGFGTDTLIYDASKSTKDSVEIYDYVQNIAELFSVDGRHLVVSTLGGTSIWIIDALNNKGRIESIEFLDFALSGYKNSLTSFLSNYRTLNNQSFESLIAKGLFNPRVMGVASAEKVRQVIDSVYSFNNDKTVVYSSKSRTLPQDAKNLVLTGKNNLNGTGNGLKNRITGNSGKNLLDGKGDADVMIGGKGNDTYVVNHSKDRVIEKARGGIDTIRSSVSQTLSANVENLILTGSRTIRGIGNNSKNRITGNSGKNILDGKGDADVMIGGKGNDTIIGGRGRDILTGSTGADTFVYRSTRESGVGRAKRDVITDFDGESNDKVDLSAIDAFTKKRGNQAFTFIGSNGFSGNRGEVRFSGGVLQVNTRTDKRADMEIDLTGVTDFSADFLIL